MPLLIGLDEAGYGPNLGPLVIAATVWDVPDDPRRFDPWAAFTEVVSSSLDPAGRMVQIADSKVVHSSSAGITAIERSALTLARLAQRDAATLFTLWDRLTERSDRLDCGEPWFEAGDLPLPLGRHAQDPAELAARWAERCDASACRLVALACDIVPAARFNTAVAATGTKGRVLSEATLALLRRVWDPSAGVPALVLCDKHGGRDRYGDLLAAAFPEVLPLGLEESRGISRYRLGEGEVRFQVKSERHFPVAAASIVAKYLREACMAAFNRFWQARLPGLKPTAGYPVDAKRFLAEIEAEATTLGLPRGVFWRCR